MNGGYTEFGEWSECSAECGEGTQTRIRTCTNPAPANGGLDCVGEASQTRPCKERDCPGYFFVSLLILCLSISHLEDDKLLFVMVKTRIIEVLTDSNCC